MIRGLVFNPSFNPFLHDAFELFVLWLLTVVKLLPIKIWWPLLIFRSCQTYGLHLKWCPLYIFLPICSIATKFETVVVLRDYKTPYKYPYMWLKVKVNGWSSTQLPSNWYPFNHFLYSFMIKWHDSYEKLQKYLLDFWLHC